MKVEFTRASFYATELTHEEAAASELWVGWMKLKDNLGYRTGNLMRVAPLLEHCVGEARKRVQAWVDKRTSEVAASVAVVSDISVPTPDGLAYRPYQLAGIAFMAARHSSLNADVPRLGKTIQTLGVINRYGRVLKVLVVAPAVAKGNWKREADKWLVRKGSVDYAEGSVCPVSDFLIINYELLARHADYLRSVAWDVVVFDEAHALKNKASQRTKICLGGDGHKPLTGKLHRIFLTGTPIFVRPIDVWNLVKACDPHDLGRSWFSFVHRYCAAKKDGFGLDVSGSSHEAELQYKMRRNFMIRRVKSDIMTELKPTREIVRLPKTGLAKIIRGERNVVQQNLARLYELLDSQEDRDIDEALSAFTELNQDAIGPLSSLRRELAVAKIDMAAEFIEEVLLTEEKVVVWVHHREVAEKLYAKFPDGILLIGGLTTKQRDDRVTEFQTDPMRRVAVCNISSAGTAISLSAADCAIFVELSYIPAELDQAEERIWLVEKTVPMTIIKLVVEDTLEARMAELIELRQAGIDRNTNRQHMAGVVI